MRLKIIFSVITEKFHRDIRLNEEIPIEIFNYKPPEEIKLKELD